MIVYGGKVKGCRILRIFGERHNDLSEKTVEIWGDMI